MAIFIAYNRAVKKNPDKKFGTGVEEGIAAPEASNNAVVASSMIPLLSLGVPGNSTSALFLGALTIQGLRVGPSLFKENTDMAYMIILGFLVANIIILPLSLIYCNFFATGIFKIKKETLTSIIVILCVTGAYSVNNNIFNIFVIIFFGFLGYFLNKYNIPISSLILGAVLGKMMESNWIQSMVLLDSSVLAFLTRPITLVLFIMTILFISLPIIKKKRKSD